MHEENFEQGPIRPPDESNSLLIRTTRSCPWNKCGFCTLFKGCQFSIRSVNEIKSDIWAARKYYREYPFESCFLQDGDSFVMKTNDLLEVLLTLKKAFPSLKRISSYGRAQSMIKKSPREMKEICDAGLNMLYCGMESGSDSVLKLHTKGTISAKIVESSLNASESGMRMMLFILLGLGGKNLSNSHINESADVLNRVNPDDIRILTLAAKQGTPLGDMEEKGDFTMLTEVEMMEEQKLLITKLKGINSGYGNYHSIDLFTELKGNLPNDKPRFLSLIESFLNLSSDARHNFILGKRLGQYHRLADINDSAKYAYIEKQLEEIRRSSQDLDDFFHDIRKKMI